jgi:hypothetical protein
VWLNHPVSFVAELVSQLPAQGLSPYEVVAAQSRSEQKGFSAESCDEVFYSSAVHNDVEG